MLFSSLSVLYILFVSRSVCVHKLFFVDVEYCSAIPIAEVVFPAIVQVTSAASRTDPSS